MKKWLPIVIYICLLAHFTLASAQNEEKSLLWRISGKGMQRPSYLYGTFHIRAKKVFEFPDSLYAAIDNTDVFALELNLDSLNNGLTAYIQEHLEDEQEKEAPQKQPKLKDLLTKEERKELRELIAENLDVDPDELTPQQIYLMKDKFIKQTVRADDMPTFMDAFLYSIARDKGKIIGGLEQYADQVKLLDNPALLTVDPKKLLEVFRKGEKAEDQMMELYLNKNLQKIGEFSSMYNPEGEDALITSRNKVMLRSMDSIMQRHSLFAAVGAMHLPGSKGLITLLREKGYTVQPVFCATTTNGADYHFKNADKGWITMVSEPDGYSVKMPGNPSDMDAYDGLVKLKSYFDIIKSRYYMAGHIPKPESSSATPEAVIREMQKAMLKKSKDLEIKDLEKSGMKGKEYFFSDEDGNRFQMQLFGNNLGVYLLMSYSNKADVQGVDSFFHSFRLLGEPQNSTPATIPDETERPIDAVLNKPKVLWQNTYNVNFSIPQQAGFSSDSKYFAMGYPEGRVVVYEVATGDVFTEYQLNSGHVYCTVFQPGGHLLASGDGNGQIVTYDYMERKEIGIVEAHDKTLTAITFSKDGSLLISGGKDKTIKIWNPQNGSLLTTINDVVGKIQSLRITSDNKTIVAGTTTLSNGLRLFDASNGREMKKFETDNLQLLDISPDNRYVATANLEKNVVLYDIKKNSRPTRLRGHHRWLTDVAFSPSGKILYSSSEDRTVIAWNMLHFTPIGIIFNADRKIASIAISPNGQNLAVMDESGTFSILDISKMEVGLR